MQESKDLKPTAEEDKAKERLEDRKSDATSKETLEDLKNNEKVADSKPEQLVKQTSVPSPDGTPDPDRSGGRADGSDPGGPM